MAFFSDPALWMMAGVIFLGAVVQGSVGFGYALIAAPVAMLVQPQLIPGPLTLISLGITLATTFRERRSMGRPAGLPWIVVGLLPGYWLGSHALVFLPPRETAYFFGCAVLIAVGISFSGLRMRPRPVTLLPAGFLAGFMSITTTMGGPPLAIALQDLPGPQLRGTLALAFTAGSLISLSILHAIGRFGPDEFWQGMHLLPFAILGLMLSGPLSRWLDRGSTRVAVLLLAALSGLAVMLRQFFSG
ncbi:MAG: sulfite exporter TauE/SafE family protein [Magnetococcus sp. DMHC-1]|nr:sulfite exporter TauE/SafE family protein [Magnetococcales bacterium]